MADLDELYIIWSESKSDEVLNDMLTAVRKTALRMTRNDDAAQDSCVAVLEGLDSFVPAKHDSFTRWVRSIAMHRRLRLIPSAIEKRTTHIDVDLVMDGGVSDDYADLDAIAPALRPIAHRLMLGDSIAEIAESMNLKPRSLHKKVARGCLKKAA